ncbi:hypothetical protein L0F63_001094, partial [Massospora cicadina]
SRRSPTPERYSSRRHLSRSPERSRYGSHAYREYYDRDSGRDDYYDRDGGRRDDRRRSRSRSRSRSRYGSEAYRYSRR